MAGVMTATVPRRRNLAQEGVPVNALMHPLALEDTGSLTVSSQ
jgi:hypothetical protein